MRMRKIFGSQMNNPTSEMGSRSLEVVLTSLFFCILIFPYLVVGASQHDCKASSCRKGGKEPSVRFPFWLKGRQQLDNCSYPGFELSCNEKNETVLELPYSGKFLVKRIDYKSQQLVVDDPGGCLQTRLPYLNFSSSHFHDKNIGKEFNITFFNCSSVVDRGNGDYIPISCLSVPGYQVYAFDLSDFYPGYFILSSCTKLKTVRSRYSFSYPYGYGDVRFEWSTPNCTVCEANGNICGLNNTEGPEIVCFDIRGPPTKLVATAVTSGFLLLVVATVVAIRIYRSCNIDKIEKENRIKIEKFLEDYRSLKPSRYTYADLKRITEQFKNKLGEGGFGSVFKGKLSNEIPVAVKLLNNSKGNGDEFINEVGTIGRIHHINVVRLVGFCADGFRRALVYEFLPNESLEKFIFSRDAKKPSLGWKKLQDIAIGIAKGIEYLHQGCDQRILHFDIKPHNILLDNNFHPKISDFGLAKLCSKEESAVSMTAARGTMGYIAPEVFSRNFGNVSYKSDVYSFGMVLLEMVGGRKNIDVTVESTSQVYFPEWIYNRLCQGNELGIKVDEEGDAKIAEKLIIVALWCIQWYPVDRPSMKVVVQMLEGDTEILVVPPNPFTSTTPSNTGVVIPHRPRHRELTVISELE